LDFTTRAVRDRVYERLASKGHALERDTGGGPYWFYIMLTKAIPLDQIAMAPDVLDGLVRQWLGYWKFSGALKLKRTR
jgi:hypothetical protein